MPLLKARAPLGHDEINIQIHFFSLTVFRVVVFRVCGPHWSLTPRLVLGNLAIKTIANHRHQFPRYL
jgi:hypothetical protein